MADVYDRQQLWHKHTVGNVCPKTALTGMQSSLELSRFTMLIRISGRKKPKDPLSDFALSLSRTKVCLSALDRTTYIRRKSSFIIFYAVTEGFKSFPSQPSIHKLSTVRKHDTPRTLGEKICYQLA